MALETTGTPVKQKRVRKPKITIEVQSENEQAIIDEAVKISQETQADVQVKIKKPRAPRKPKVYEKIQESIEEVSESVQYIKDEIAPDVKEVQEAVKEADLNQTGNIILTAIIVIACIVAYFAGAFVNKVTDHRDDKASSIEQNVSEQNLSK